MSDTSVDAAEVQRRLLRAMPPSRKVSLVEDAGLRRQFLTQNKIVFQRLSKGHCNRLQKGGYMARTTRKAKKKVKSRQEKKAKASSNAKSVSNPAKRAKSPSQTG